MTEFALIVPVFLVIVAGLLGFGRVFFYWIETNHEASEAARWAVVDRNPYQDGRTSRRRSDGCQRSSSTPSAARRSSSQSDASVCIDFPRAARRPRRARRVQDPEAVHLRADPRHRDDHDPGHVDDADRALRQRRLELRQPHDSARAHRSVHMSRSARRARRDPRPRRGDDPGVPPSRRSSSTSATGTRTSASCRTRPMPERSRPASSTLAAQQLRHGPGDDRTRSRDVAKRYAGTDGGDRGHEVQPDDQRDGRLTVRDQRVERRRPPTGRDGGSPCVDHTTDPDAISPTAAIWTDVKVRETNIGTLFGGFGLEPPVSRRAGARRGEAARRRPQGRTSARQRDGRPVDCVWAQFVERSDGSTSGILAGGASNPVPLTRIRARRVAGRRTSRTASTSPNRRRHRGPVLDGQRRRRGSCNFSTQHQGPAAARLRRQTDPVRSTGSTSTTTTLARRRRGTDAATTSADARTRAADARGFIYTTSSCNDRLQCRGRLQGRHRHVPERRHGRSSMQPDRERGDPATRRRSRHWTRRRSPDAAELHRSITFNPNEVCSSDRPRSQDYTQVGPTSASRALGRRRPVESAAAPSGHLHCRRQPVHRHVPERDRRSQLATCSTLPRRSAQLEPRSRPSSLSGARRCRTPGPPAAQTRAPSRSTFTNLGVDQTHIVARARVRAGDGQPDVERSDCGAGQAARSALRDAIRDGCPVPLVDQPARATRARPAPPARRVGAWDCVQTRCRATRPRRGKGSRIGSPARCRTTGTARARRTSPTATSAARTSSSRASGAASTSARTTLAADRRLPPDLRRPAGTSTERRTRPCGGDNDAPPRGYDDNGAQLWGHFVDVDHARPTT